MVLTEYRYRHISFLSDYGDSDEFAGACRGAMLRIAPEVTIIDITHLVAPFQITQGAILLARAVPFLPRSVHLAVVDPGVGSSRRPVVIETADGSCLVGPDNGLLIPAAEKLGGVAACRLIDNPQFMLPERSSTFHGRDIFAPAAAHIAAGLAPERLGPAVEHGSLVPLALPAPRPEGGGVTGIVVHRDRFGNLELNLNAKNLADMGIGHGDRVDLQIGARKTTVMYVRTFSAVQRGEALLFEDSHHSIALGVNSGSAADLFNSTAGAAVFLQPAGN